MIALAADFLAETVFNLAALRPTASLIVRLPEVSAKADPSSAQGNHRAAPAGDGVLVFRRARV
jgi:hypothetical protein